MFTQVEPLSLTCQLQPGSAILKESFIQSALDHSIHYTLLRIYLVWCPEDRTYLEYFVDLTGTREEGPEGVDLSHDAAHSPQVNGGVVVGGAKEDLWCSIPMQ